MLAAGMGKRLGRYTQNGTKCMVKVNGKSLIEYAIESLIYAGIKDFYLVVGYKKDVLKEFLNDKYPQINIHYIDNDVFETTNNIYSLFLAKDVLCSDDTILLESDLIYTREIIKEILESKEKNLAVVSPFESWMDGTVAVLNHDNGIKAIIGKADFDWSNTNSYYKTVNIYKFSKEFSKSIYIPFLNAYQTAFGKNEYYETVLKVISFLDGRTLKAYIVEGFKWYEIDDPADLAVAETRFSTGKAHLKKIAQNYGGYWRFPSMLDFCYLVNPYFPPENLVHELESNFRTLLINYPSGDRQQSLLAGKIFSINPEYIAVGNGAAELISSVGELTEGKVVVPYPSFNEYPERFGKERTVWMKTDSNDFSYTTQDILNCVRDNDAKYVLLINPDNPSGHFFILNEVLFLLDELKKLNVTLIFDESFVDFAKKNIRYTLLNESLLEKYPNLIVIKSLSKSYGIPGIRLGVIACSSKELISKVQKKTSIWNINSYGEFFLQIFEKYRKSYEVSCDKIAEERERFSKELSKIDGIKVFESQANYILCLLKQDSLVVAEKLLDSKNILIKDLSTKFGFDGKSFIRLAVRDNHDNNILLEALKNL